MADAVFVAVALGFFALCVGYVRVLDRLVGRSEDAETGEPLEPAEPEPVPEVEEVR